MGKQLSVIIPAFNEELTIEKAANDISKILLDENIESELIFVDDGSKDKTWDKIKKVCSEKDNIRGVHFSRNFGKESAIMAGLEASVGECCVVIDCDLQHPPEKIVEMFHLWQQGYEVIEGQKNSRGNENIIHTWFAKCFLRYN